MPLSYSLSLFMTGYGWPFEKFQAGSGYTFERVCIWSPLVIWLSTSLQASWENFNFNKKSTEQLKKVINHLRHPLQSKAFRSSCKHYLKTTIRLFLQQLVNVFLRLRLIADWNELFTTKCVACGFPIEAGDRWVEALNSNYHSQCFNCTVSFFSTAVYTWSGSAKHYAGSSSKCCSRITPVLCYSIL